MMEFLNIRGCFSLLGAMTNLEEFVAQVYTEGRVTVPRQLRKRFDVKDGDYVRLVLVEVFRENDAGEWVKRKVE